MNMYIKDMNMYIHEHVYKMNMYIWNMYIKDYMYVNQTEFTQQNKRPRQ